MSEGAGAWGGNSKRPASTPWLTSRDGLPPALRRMLHCTIDQLADPRDARRQARRRALRPTRRRGPLPAVRPVLATGGVRLAAAVGRDVRRRPRARRALAEAPRARDRADRYCSGAA